MDDAVARLPRLLEGLHAALLHRARVVGVHQADRRGHLLQNDAQTIGRVRVMCTIQAERQWASRESSTHVELEFELFRVLLTGK